MSSIRETGKRVVRRIIGQTEWNLRRHIRSEGGRLPADVPRVNWMDSVLKTRRQVEEAVREAERCGLVRHPDRPKNWDALAAVHTVLGRTDTSARVLEMGAPFYSVMLQWLYQYGYRDLIGIDLVHRAPVHRGPIRYEFGDLTKTRFADGSFDVICAMSVIEHGVDLACYFAEAARLLRPGGLLITSTDCWKEPVDTRGQAAFGVPIKIFTTDEISVMLHGAKRHGFQALGDIDLLCEEPAVTWAKFGLEYTFVCFTLVRQSAHEPGSSGRGSLSSRIPNDRSAAGGPPAIAQSSERNGAR